MRVPVSLTVAWSVRSETYRSRIRNISLGGCYVQSVNRVALGDQVTVEAQLPSGSRMKLYGEVVHKQWPLGFGLRFSDVSDQELSRVVRLIDEQKGGCP